MSEEIMSRADFIRGTNAARLTLTIYCLELALKTESVDSVAALKAIDLIKSYIEENDLESAVTAPDTGSAVTLAALWLINNAMSTAVFMTEDPKLIEANNLIHEEAKKVNEGLDHE